MASRSKRPPELVTLVPVAGAWIPGVPATELSVSPEEAERLLAHQPPAFTVKEPEVPVTGEEIPS